MCTATAMAAEQCGLFAVWGHKYQVKFAKHNYVCFCPHGCLLGRWPRIGR